MAREVWNPSQAVRGIVRSFVQSVRNHGDTLIYISGRIGNPTREACKRAASHALNSCLRWRVYCAAALFSIIFVRITKCLPVIVGGIRTGPSNRCSALLARKMTRSALCKRKRVYYIAITTSKGGYQRDNLRMKIARSRGPEHFRDQLSWADTKFDLKRQPRQDPGMTTARRNESLRSAGLSGRCGVRRVLQPAVRVFNLQISSGLQIDTHSSDLPCAHPLPSTLRPLPRLFLFSAHSLLSRWCRNGKARYGERQEATIPFLADPALMNFPACTQSHFRLLSWRSSASEIHRWEAKKLCTGRFKISNREHIFFNWSKWIRDLEYCVKIKSFEEHHQILRVLRCWVFTWYDYDTLDWKRLLENF